VSIRPHVSIGIPVYNGGKFFRETLDSFLAQTFSDFELVIADNASTDETEDIAREYAARDRRVRYFRNTSNIGLSRNHNRVFELSCGEYFKWAPADDICCPTYIERCVEVLDRNSDVVLVYPKTRFIDQEGHHLGIEDPGWPLVSDSAAERFRYVLYHGHWANSAMGLIRRSALERTRLMPDYPGGDFRVLGELSTMGKFFEVPEYLFVRRLHERSSSQHTNDPGWQAKYWATQKRMPWPFLQLKVDQGLTIMRSGFTASEKASLIVSLLRTIVGGRRRVLHEFQSHLQFFFANHVHGSASRES
jgi:glycosyltransferase involved in cell wall biosynthesis